MPHLHVVGFDGPREGGSRQHSQLLGHLPQCRDQGLLRELQVLRQGGQKKLLVKLLATRRQIWRIRVLAKNLPFLASTRIRENARPAKFLLLCREKNFCLGKLELGLVRK